MLVLSRKKNQQVFFPHLGIKVEILRVAGSTVSLGVEAPKSVQILRGELCLNEADSAASINQPSRSVVHQLRNQLHRAQMIVSLAQKQLESGQVENPDQLLQDMLRRLNELEKATQPAAPAANVAADCDERKVTGVSNDGEGSKHALLVEDDANERALLAAYLRLCGFRVTEVGDGLEAMDFLAQHTVDLIVLDMHMPRMNGLETLRALQRHADLSHTRVVVVSGEDRDRIVRPENAGEAAVVSQWFAKPLNPVHLVDHLQAVMN